MNISILGAGAWGTALAIHLQKLGHTVTLVPRRIDHALDVASSRENKDYLPGLLLDDSIQIGCELRPALMEADVVLMACPSKGLREWCKRIKADLPSAWRIKMLVTLCKGLEKDTLKLPSEVVKDDLPGLVCASLSGPNFAGEVAQGKPAATVLAAEANHDLILQELQDALSSDLFRVYRSHDLRGVELGGCLKNVYAIGIGCCQGLELGDNAQAALLTRALHEMTRIGVSLGGKRESFYGLSGFGDLMVTCTGQASRNRSFGYEIGKGRTVEELMTHRKTVVEGYWATECFMRACQEHQIDAPILSEIYGVLYKNKSPKQSMLDLMTRALKYETL